MAEVNVVLDPLWCLFPASCCQTDFDSCEKPSMCSGSNNDNNNDQIARRNSRFVLPSPHCAADCFQHVRSSGQGVTMSKSRATHRALIKCNVLCATWYEGTAQLSKVDRV